MEENNFNFTYTDYVPFLQIGIKKFYKKNTNLKDEFDFNAFTNNSSINTTTMIINREIVGVHRFRKIKLMEDYLFKCQLMKRNNIAKKLNENLAYYRILGKSRSSQRLKNIFSLWYINKKYNKFGFFRNLISIISISINSIKKYGFK